MRGNEKIFGPGPITSPPAGGPGFGPSAADYANSVGFRATVNNIAAHFIKSSPLVPALVANAWIRITQPWNIVTSAARMLWLGEDATVVITFDDGSKVVLEFKFETPQTAAVKAIRDAEGRDIMTASNRRDFSNSVFTFPNGGPAAMENFILNAINLGIPVENITDTPLASGCSRISNGVSCRRLL